MPASISNPYNFYACNSLDVGYCRRHGVFERIRFSIEVKILDPVDATDQSGFGILLRMPRPTSITPAPTRLGVLV